MLAFVSRVGDELSSCVVFSNLWLANYKLPKFTHETDVIIFPGFGPTKESC